MEQVVLKLVEQSPAMAVMIVLVILFLRHIKDERREQNLFFSAMHEDNINARKEGRESIEKNSVEMSKNIAVTTKNTETIERLCRTIEGCNLRTNP